MAAIFDPTVINNLAFWFEARLGGCFQDSAGTTTPATANDDPVGYLPDRSGNAYHATQATAGSRPLLKTAGFNGLQCLRFDGTADILSLGNPSALSGASRSGWTATYVLSIVATTAYGTVLSRGVEDVDVWDWLGTNVISGTAQPNSVNYGFRMRAGLKQAALATATKYIISHRVTPTTAGTGIISNLHEFFINGQLAGAMVLSNGSQGTTWSIGGRNDSAFFASIDLAGLTFFSRSISDAELQQLESYFATIYNIQTAEPSLRTSKQSANGPVNLILDGNSISAGYRGCDAYYAQARPDIRYEHTVHNIAQDGTTTSARTTAATTQLAAILSKTKLNVVLFNEITNELGNGVSAATCYSNVVAYCNAVKALDPLVRIIVMTPLSRNFVANQVAYEANRQTVMTSLRTAGSPVWDYLLDVGGTTTISVFGTTFDVSLVGAPGSYSSTTYFNDGIHPTRLGHALIAGPVAAAVNGVVAQYLEPIAAVKRGLNSLTGLVA